MSLEDAHKEVDAAITREDLKGLSYENTFGGVVSFARRRLTKDLDGVDLAITGIPFDQAVTNRPGTRLGPRAIREASLLQAPDPPYGWDVDPLSDFACIDYGDMAFDYARVADFPEALADHMRSILAAGVGVIALGGDHSISYPILKAHAEVHGPLSLLQFDAHTDTWEGAAPGRIDHGTMFRAAIADGLIAPERSVQVGIRTTNPETMGVHIIDAPEVHRIGPDGVIAKIRDILGSSRTYLTFDIDCLDPAFAPGTGTPVWGGLSSAQAAAILRGLAGIDMIGGDVVEVSPPYDPSGATAIAGAHVAVELMGLYCTNLQRKRRAQSTD